MLTLLYHNVLATPADHLPVAEGQVTLETFSKHLLRFRDHLLHPMDVYEQSLRGREPEGILVTFDDGAAGIIQAGEILAGMGAVGVAFICPGALESGLWFYRLADSLARAGVPRAQHGGYDLPLTDSIDKFNAYQVLSKELFDLPALARDDFLAGFFDAIQPVGDTDPTLTTLDESGLRQAAETSGLIFANHSWSHPNLVKLPGDELEREIGDAQSWLEMSGLPVLPWFAFPRGDHDARVREVVAKFCPIAFGASAREPEPRILPRTYLCQADANWWRFAAKTTWNGRFRQRFLWR